jgi:hypothetical protein
LRENNFSRDLSAEIINKSRQENKNLIDENIGKSYLQNLGEGAGISYTDDGNSTVQTESNQMKPLGKSFTNTRKTVKQQRTKRRKGNSLNTSEEQMQHGYNVLKTLVKEGRERSDNKPDDFDVFCELCKLRTGHA